MNRNILVTYKSKTGKTKRYADMIAEELGVKAVEFGSVDRSTIKDCDLVVYGAGVYAGKINGLKEAKETSKDVRHGRFILFATGGTPSTDRKAIQRVWEANLPGIDMERIPHYYLPAGICYERMTFGQKFMMKIAASVMESQRNGEFRESLKKSYDLITEDSIVDMVERIKNMTK